MSKRLLVSEKEAELAKLPDHMVDEAEREERRKDSEFIREYSRNKRSRSIKPSTYLDLCVILVTLLILYLILKATHHSKAASS
ncbi:hypothetical protein RCL1_003962 [Eukaryota sp. TZLM3-RCL]